ncbi:MAG TPA: S-layer homology domain-containing protein [Chloroflexia bacterium]|nr:S-layer homology domain-containing protein [Chloroflexia bacterium]
MKRTFWILIALCVATGALALAGSVARIEASPTVQQAWSDPLRHLSGVVAVPPETMMRPAGGEVDKLWGPLNPPVFGPNVDASLNNSAAQNETTISIYSANDQRVIASANDYRANLKPWVYLSTNGGTTWTNYQVPGTTGLFYGDPAMAYGPDNGKAYFSYLGYAAICTPEGGMYVSRSDNAGDTFSAPILLAANVNIGPFARFQDKEYVAADRHPGSPNYRNAYVAWVSYTFAGGVNCGSASSQIEAPIVLSRSTDQGISWSVPITVSPPISDNNQGAVPVTGNNGEVYLYYVGAATQSQLNYDAVLFSRSTDGGQTFPFFTRISNLVDIPSPLPGTSFRDNPFGAMAADRTVNGYLYAVWADYRNGDADILLSRSTDNGNTWGAPTRVNDDPLANGKDQYFPWIASSEDGLVHVAWHDEREDPNGAQYKAYYTYSSDHGATWAGNIAVSTAPSNPGSSTFIGDYAGIDAVPGVVMPVWTDIRVGANQNAYTARGVKSMQGTATPTQPPPTNTSTATSTRTATAPATNTATPQSTATSSNTPQPPTGTATVEATVEATATPCTISFTDVPPDHTFYSFIRCLACRGIISGYSDGTFQPGNDITRGQIAKMVSNSAGFNEDPGPQIYEDVPEASPFYAWINRLSMRGHMGGYPCGLVPEEPCLPPDNRPYFRPNASATRGQLAKIVANAAGIGGTPTGIFYTDVQEDHPFYVWIMRLTTLGVMSGYPCGTIPEEPCDEANRPYFRSFNNVTRGQASKIVANTFFPGCDTPRR